MAEDGESKVAEVATKEGPNRDDVSVSIMGNVLEKLRVLSYERELGKKKAFTPYSDTQFVYLSGNASSQFKSFLELVLFLMKQCKQEFVVDKYDDPNTSVNKLILTLKVMGSQLDYPASKLKLGYGEAACATLDFLCDQALNTANITWARPSYPREDFADEAEVDEDAEVDSADEDPVVEEEEEEIYSDLVKTQVPTEEDELDKSMQQMIISQVDPLMWKTELERVGPRLKVNAKVDDGREWHTHIERAKKHDAIMEGLLPHVQTQLKLISSQLAEIGERMGTKEKVLNNQFEELRQDYHQLQTKLQSISDKCKESSDKVNTMTTEHAEVTEQLRDLKNTMDERGSKMTDTSPLVQIKEALKSIGAEIKTFDLRIGVVSHTLLAVKNRQLVAARQRKAGTGYEDPEYDQSDEDSS